MSGQARDIKLSQPAHRGLSQLRHQAVERRALLPDERLRRASRASIRPTVDAHASTAGSAARPLKAARAVTAALDACAFDDAADALYRFIWNVFCDWYVELAKPILNGDDEAAKAETRAMAAWVLDDHPEAAAPGHAVHHRGAVGADRAGGPGARAAADRRALAGPAGQLRRRGGRGRDRPGHRRHHRGPLGARRAERAAGRAAGPDGHRGRARPRRRR